jgi:cytochrome bd-type quinol oxidase subunit 2
MNRTLTKFAIAASSTVASLAAPAVAFAQGIQLDEDINPGTGFADDFGSLVNGVLSFVMVIAALLVFMYLILGGIEWITSGGDKGKTESARNKITAAVIGLVILAASYAILLIVLRFLGFENLGDVFDQTKTLNG